MSLIADREPTVLEDDVRRRVVYRWTVRRIEDGSAPGTLVVNLTVWHDKAGKAFQAELRNATVDVRGVSVEAFWADEEVWSRREPVGRYSKTRLAGFAAKTLAELRRADADGEDLFVDLAGRVSRDRPDGDRHDAATTTPSAS
jgi:hypothetical protein